MAVDVSLSRPLSGQSTVPWTGVHLATPYSFADYATGRDPALEAVYNYTPPPLLAPTLIDAAKAGGVDATLKALAAYTAIPAYRYLNFAVIVPGAVNQLLGAKQPDAALAIARQSVKDYPESLDAWFMLAIAADKTGHPDIALAAAKRVIAIDPNNRSIRSLLTKLSAAS